MSKDCNKHRSHQMATTIFQYAYQSQSEKIAEDAKEACLGWIALIIITII